MLHLSFPRPRVRTLAALGAAALALATAGVLASASAYAALPALDTTAMVSVTPAVTPTAGNNLSSQSSVSTDGRFVAFTSLASDLVGVGSHEKTQVYKRDMATGVTTLVSAAMFGEDSGNADSDEPSISADGRFVAFTSLAHNLALPIDVLDVHKQVYVRDTVEGVTRKLSLTPRQLSGGNDDSASPSISADGSRVAFQSAATDLLVGLTTTDTQVYLAQNAADPSIQAVSLRDGAMLRLPDDDSTHPSISGDGGTVAFVSAASNLSNAPGNGQNQVYTRTLATSVTKLITFNRTDMMLAADGPSGDPSVSLDGSFVAYESAADDLVAVGVGRSSQVYEYDRAADHSVLVSFSALGAGGAVGNSSDPSISSDGNTVAFVSASTDITATPTSGKLQVYVRDVNKAVTKAVSVQAADPRSGGTADSTDPSLSGDADYVGFTSLAIGITAIPTLASKTHTYLRAVGAAAPPTPTATPTATPSPTGGTVAPTAGGTGAPGTSGSTGGGQGGSGGGSGSGGSHLASTGLSQAPIIAAGAGAALLALVGGSILFGARAARRRKEATPSEE